MIGRYTAHPDKLVAAGNTLAIIVASNQPTYPPYVWLATGSGAWLLAVDHPLHLFGDDGYAMLRRLNAISALALCGLVGWLAPRWEGSAGQGP